MKDWSFEEVRARGMLEGIIVEEEFVKDIRSGKKLAIYQGFDPTSPRLHIGSMVGLRVLRWFQLHGHRVIFLVGDFTGRIGDPTDKAATRKQLTEEEVQENARTYKEQVSGVLSFDGENPVEMLFNSEWLGKLTFKDVAELAANVTVQQMIQRDMFQKRLEENKPISLHEFLYPVMQGYDSVVMEVDVELGGRDQLFNMLVGRDLEKAYLGKTKHVLTTPLLPGLDGRKMGKTEGNTVDLTEPPVSMFQRLTLIQDALLPLYLNILTDVPSAEIREIEKRLETEANLIDARKRFAREVVTTLHSAEAAKEAEAEFDRVVGEGELPTDMPTVRLSRAECADGECRMIELVAATKLASSKGEARRMIQQGGIKIDDKSPRDPFATVPLDELDGTIIKVGKRGLVKVVVGE